MNKVFLLGRLTRDPEVRYSQGAEPIAVVKYTLAVNKRFKRDGEPDADFINCVAFGKVGEFAEKYFRKGQQVSVIGRIQVRSYDKDGQKHWTTDIIIEEQYFADSKNSGSGESRSSFSSDPLNYYTQNPPSAGYGKQDAPPDGFMAITESIDDEDLPF